MHFTVFISFVYLDIVLSCKRNLLYWANKLLLLSTALPFILLTESFLQVLLEYATIINVIPFWNLWLFKALKFARLELPS